MNHVIAGHNASGNDTLRYLRVYCPRCGHILEGVSFESTRADRCRQCHGLWFDRGELRSASAFLGRHLRAREADFWSQANRADFRGSDIECPRCLSLMCAFSFEGSDVMVDFCLNCAGVWLDRDELLKLPPAL